MTRHLTSPRARPAPRQQHGDASAASVVVVRLLAGDDANLLDGTDDTLVGGVDRHAATRLLGDPRRHVAVALAGTRIVGIAFASHRPRPPGAPELVVGDVTVVASHRRRGIGRRLLALLLAHGRVLGCGEATAETERDNAAMRRLCAGMGGVERREPTVRVSFPLA